MTLDLTTAADRARALADDILFPAAQDTDRARLVPRLNLDALGEAGLFGLFAPAESGGLGAGHVEARPTLEAIAGGCGATAFVWAQHHGAVRRIAGADGPARQAWLARLSDGSTLAGIGFAYLRRPGPPAVRASRIDGGWRIDGQAPWISGWGLIGMLVVMARADDGSVVTVAVDGLAEHPSLRAGQPQQLAVMAATGTVTVTFDGLQVSDADVVGVQSSEGWRRRDQVGSALPPPAPLGIADRAIRLLAERPPGAGIAEAATTLAHELATRRAEADRISGRVAMAMEGDAAAVNQAVGIGAAERDRGLDLARRASDALIAASGGGAMSLSHPAQRLAREASFYLIQAQTGALRAASLARMGRTGTVRPDG